MGSKKLVLKKRKMANPSIGYQKRFTFDIDMHSNGINGVCIEWCEKNCLHKWGWWFEATDEPHPTNHWEHQRAYMSFEDEKEAMRFWLAIGIQNMGND
ncbi:MAG TPA: hypothetical protein DCG42_01760 [Maribacter sp.]|nr:hypothetical protein [Maribacter sp.]